MVPILGFRVFGFLYYPKRMVYEPEAKFSGSLGPQGKAAGQGLGVGSSGTVVIPCVGIYGLCMA